MAFEIYDTAEQLNRYVDGRDAKLSSSAVNILEQIELCWNSWTLLFRGTLWRLSSKPSGSQRVDWGDYDGRC